MAGAGWTKPVTGYTDPRMADSPTHSDGPCRPTDTPATYSAIARGAAAALLGTDQYLLTIEPYQGRADGSVRPQRYASLRTMTGYIIRAPIAILIALATGNPLEVALVAGALVAIAAVYWRAALALDAGPRADSFWP